VKIFQTVKGKDGYVFYYDGKLHLDPPSGESGTWEFYNFLSKEVFFAKILC
jgi:hypothetical protein